jgi:hypothetical protein
VRTVVRRRMLCVRRPIAWRARFWADLMFAMGEMPCKRGGILS